jgi:hypothetical protein
MQIDDHRRIAERITASMELCGEHDYEAIIEGAMLAGSHWANFALHGVGVTKSEADIVHTYMITANEFQLYALWTGRVIDSLAEIERLRPPFVRGDMAGGRAAGSHARQLLEAIRTDALVAVREASN